MIEGWTIFVIVIMVITVIVSTVIILSWSKTVKTQIKVPEIQGYLNSEFGLRCTPNDINPTVLSALPKDFIPPHCAEGYDCVKFSNQDPWGFCYKQLDRLKCSSLSECVFEAKYCSRVCSLTRSGGIGQYCNPDSTCNGPNLICDFDNVCRYIQGEECSIDDQCYQSVCKNLPGETIRRCISKREDGEPCQINEQCFDGSYCDSKGFCQPEGIISKELNAKCQLFMENAPGCNPSLVCSFDYSNPYVPFGQCLPLPLQWDTKPCGGCIPPSICFNGKCVLPRSPELYLTNSCGIQTSGQCIPNYNCQSSFCVPSIPGLPTLTGNLGIVLWIPDESGSTIGQWVPKTYPGAIFDGFSSISAITFGENDVMILAFSSSEYNHNFVLKGGISYPIQFTVYDYMYPSGTHPVSSPKNDIFILDCKFLPDAKHGLIFYTFVRNHNVNYGCLIIDITSMYDNTSNSDVSFNSGTFTITVRIPYIYDSGMLKYSPLVDPSLSIIEGKIITKVEAENRISGEIVQIFFTSELQGTFLTQGNKNRYSGIPTGDAITSIFKSGWYFSIPYLYSKRTTGYGVVSVVDTNSRVFIEDVAHLSFPSEISCQQIGRHSFTYPVGGQFSQGHYTYLAKYASSYEVHTVIEGFDKVMPGYFNANTIPIFSYRNTNVTSKPMLLALTPVYS